MVKSIFNLLLIGMVNLLHASGLHAQATMPDSVCQGDYREYWVQMTPSSTYSWWVDGVLQRTSGHLISILWDRPGLHTLAILERTSAGCYGEVVSGVVMVNANPEVNLNVKDYQCVTFPYLLDAGEGYATYSWNDGGMMQTLLAKEQGEYGVSVINLYGCEGYASVILESCMPAFVRPTAFTPDGDGLNDTFTPVLVSQQSPTSYNFKVFNKRGQLLFESRTQGQSWDGKLDGNMLPAGSYAYQVCVTYPGDKKKTVLGTISLINLKR